MNKTGFGFLRLPRLDPNDPHSVDDPLLNAMVDRFLVLGGRYFDTAYTYLGGTSEEAIRSALVLRHPRDSFILADKLPGYKVKSYDQCRRYFDESCRRCGVDYFDVFLLHWLNDRNYAIAQAQEEFCFLQELKDQGLARKIGFSYHDGPELLHRILTEHPEVDYVQLQINYLDWDSVALQARQCYEVAEAHGKRIIIMEPVKGGSLAALPQEAEALLRRFDPAASMASWAVRFATDLPQVDVVLSGMNTMAQIEDNLQSLKPLTNPEREALAEAARIIRSQTAVPCTGCGYCLPHCPVSMPIPRYFALYNDYARSPGDDWKMQHAYDALARTGVKASACLQCRRCEANCPQQLPITEHLQAAARAFEA